MVEREIKLHVPEGSRDELEHVLRQAGATALPLHALYFDTIGRDLARAHVALRLRKEGEQWIQTLKAPGPDELSRHETEHARSAPVLDLSLYEGAPPHALLSALPSPLLVRYETDIERLVLELDTQRGTVELAYDRGTIKAGDIHLDVYELELEQISGDVSNLFAIAQEWLQQYSLVLDLRSKAERGDTLAKLLSLRGKTSDTASPYSAAVRGGSPSAKSRRATPVVLQGSMSVQQAYQLCVNDCLNQVVRNATFLAGVDTADATPALVADYVHQLRVGLRRLRTCWAFFGKWVPLPIDRTQLGTDVRRFFSLLGKVRDWDVIRLSVEPQLMQAGAPGPLLHIEQYDGPPEMPDVRQLAGSAAFQSSLLLLLEHLLSVGEGAAGQDGDLTTLLRKRLNKWLKQICNEGEQFLDLSVDAQHDLRKKVKRLRYSLDFSACLLSGKRLNRIRKTLAIAQEELGDLNDFYVAQKHYEALEALDSRALFALGWLKAMQNQKKRLVQKAFRRLRKAGAIKA